MFYLTSFGRGRMGWVDFEWMIAVIEYYMYVLRISTEGSHD